MRCLRAAALLLALLDATASMAGEPVPLDRNPSVQARLYARWLRYNPSSNVVSCSLREEVGPDGRTVMACR